MACKTVVNEKVMVRSLLQIPDGGHAAMVQRYIKARHGAVTRITFEGKKRPAPLRPAAFLEGFSKKGVVSWRGARKNYK